MLGGAGRFHTRSGELVCSAGDDGWIDMDFPADPVTASQESAAVATALGLSDATAVRFVGRGRSDVLVEVADAGVVRGLHPDQGAVAALGSRCVIVTAGGDGTGAMADCVSRVFAPNAGIAEDPATGSAHCTLAGYWGERLGREVLVGEQASARAAWCACAWPATGWC